MKIRSLDPVEHEISVNEAVSLVFEMDFVRLYDVLPAGNLLRIEIMDLAFPAFLDAVPNFKALLDNSSNLIASLDAASKQLALLPVNVELAAWDDTAENRNNLKSLFQACTSGKKNGLPMFGSARCTKLLHKKRPALIPIIDSWQLQAWGGKVGCWSLDAMVNVVFHIREQMAPYGDDFLAVQRALIKKDATFPVLTPVRIYDILSWEKSLEWQNAELREKASQPN